MHIIPREIYSISQLNQHARNLLEQNFPLIWIEGEISNFARPASGHWYFSLKDSSAQVRCAMFAMRNRLLIFKPKDGTQVLVRAKVSLYEGRGDFQLLIEHMEEAGAGALQRAFEQLKQRLLQEGLFDPAYKKPIPLLPAAIGVVTSATGAAIRDILSVLKRRFASIPIIIYPTAVQGNAAAQQIVRALALANKDAQCDVLILARGGGSLEDLWPFNEEVVARAIFNSNIPIISGVGHEVDTTIADFVADQRAATPSAAAELCSPDSAHWLYNFSKLAIRFHQQIVRQIHQQQQLLTGLSKRLRHPGERLQEQAQRLDDIEQRLRRAVMQGYHRHQARLTEYVAKLHRYQPYQHLMVLKLQLEHTNDALQQAMQQHLQRVQQQLASSSQSLDMISPLATLQRGYAIVSQNKNQSIIKSIQQVKPGDEMVTRLADGEVHSLVIKQSN